ncbi:hypothetical protein T552_02337 [Pneumocystis carinii B80]|uniref:Fcf2 pre-rRNA processing C-terminal domain-containing protein n=1 Tax=Pneumocystis carinii (strain B80) TaxID=1408658 RepID=A0A0W4ZG47_PNEC8|nr:hypothetical protein T552_02337 [Pneumocystis carinii B80]KTW27358.1 hypothetical protein T552_02337 [Pneumocystis carinii B80]
MSNQDIDCRKNQDFLKNEHLNSFNNSNISEKKNTQIVNLEAHSEEDIEYLLEKAQENLERLSKEVPVSEKTKDFKDIRNSITALSNHQNIEPKYISTVGNVSSLNSLVFEKSYKVIYDDVNHVIEHEELLSRKEKRKKQEETAGKDWFYMPKPELTQSLKTQLQILKIRNVLDPKRHYKKDNSKKPPKYFQIGTTIDDVLNTPMEDFSKKKTNSILDEILEDQDKRQYFKRKYQEIQEIKTSGKKAYYKKLKERRKPFF